MRHPRLRGIQECKTIARTPPVHAFRRIPLFCVCRGPEQETSPALGVARAETVRAVFGFGSTGRLTPFLWQVPGVFWEIAPHAFVLSTFRRIFPGNRTGNCVIVESFSGFRANDRPARFNRKGRSISCHPSFL